VDPDPENSIRSDKSREERRAEVASGLSADGGGVLKEVRVFFFWDIKSSVLFPHFLTVLSAFVLMLLRNIRDIYNSL